MEIVVKVYFLTIKIIIIYKSIKIFNLARKDFIPSLAFIGNSFARGNYRNGNNVNILIIFPDIEDE
ncbi:hypothetical protein [Sulfurisphaera tokodaii]|uniref:Uncharacterized protein n=1 Tax=Sulfurisphaera tokodaii TaxID=111955 RepID=A0A832TR95_9CREN|nr:hypothetical protein [Sulfurisphaera tokodaii]HII74023.1 hypothetical protein [Sulfurisphaera tokodaii]